MSPDNLRVKIEERDLSWDVSERLVTDGQAKTSGSPVVKQIASAVSVSSVGCVLGMVIAFSPVALDAWMQEGDVVLTENQASWFASVVQLVSIPGSVIGGGLLQVFGPRRLLLCLLPGLAFSWPVFLLWRHNAFALIILRAFQGLLLSGSAIAIYVYPCEVSEASRRGVLGALPESAFSLGFLLTYIMAGIFHWTTVVLILPFMYIPFMIALLLVPESPTWLLQHGKIEEAKTTLQSLRAAGHNVEKEVLEMQSGILSDYESQGSRCGSIKQLSKPKILLPVLASTTLLVLKECTGQLVLSLFVVHIFRSVNVGIPPHYSSMIVGSTRFLANVICVFLLGHISRRRILIVSSLLAGLSVALLWNHFNGFEPQFMSSWSPLLYLTLFMMFFGGGIGPTTYLMATELLPNSIRGLGSGIVGSAAFMTQFLITFMAAQTGVNLFTCLWGYAIGCVALAGFVYLLPETKGLSLQKLEDYWSEQAFKLSSTRFGQRNEQNNNENLKANESGQENALMKPETAAGTDKDSIVVMVDCGSEKGGVVSSI